jgi:hypothetical protein
MGELRGVWRERGDLLTTRGAEDRSDRMRAERNILMAENERKTRFPVLQ